MGYGSYEVTRADGLPIQAGYNVEAECERERCGAEINRGLAYLCGTTPGTPEDGCGGYFCEQHLMGEQRCEPCSDAATAANTWTNPATGEAFDLRDDYLPPGDPYKPDGWVWRHLGTFEGDVPVLVPVKLPGGDPGGHLGCAITAYAYENAHLVRHRQSQAPAAP